ncbi:hypothetical protein BN2475_950008 [Paraburkholderia ribeironis]|uniref:Uncharacterized protein n=1 Tax=Paraburkholderia ribeironis TaxID=1247936 RepID=A0A1N7SMG3_9BURK|nr:hypothetical protein BN2475_950008 [Paraburkholderia ribeironis]
MPRVQTRGFGLAHRSLWGVSFLLELPCVPLQTQEEWKRTITGDQPQRKGQPSQPQDLGLAVLASLSRPKPPIKPSVRPRPFGCPALGVPRAQRSNAHPCSDGTVRTIPIVSMLTRITRCNSITMYVGSSCSRARRSFAWFA